jgi:hypothetical protein
MNSTFYREYRKVNRIAGISLRDDVMLFKVLPEPGPVNQPGLMPPVPQEDRDKPWVLRFMVVIALAGLFWWGVMEAITR